MMAAILSDGYDATIRRTSQIEPHKAARRIRASTARRELTVPASASEVPNNTPGSK